MELYIRSQDKLNLVKVNNLSTSYDFDYNDDKHHYTIQEHEYGTELGYYETKERALEVLDEIQEYINNDCEFIERKSHTSMGTYTNKIKTKVYEMPEE